MLQRVGWERGCGRGHTAASVGGGVVVDVGGGADEHVRADGGALRHPPGGNVLEGLISGRGEEGFFLRPEGAGRNPHKGVGVKPPPPGSQKGSQKINKKESNPRTQTAAGPTHPPTPLDAQSSPPKTPPTFKKTGGILRLSGVGDHEGR